MRSEKVGGLVAAAACLVWLAGCETTSLTGQSSEGEAALASAQPGGETTGTLASLFGTQQAATPDLVGKDPNDDLNLGKKYFRQGMFGQAERHFRKSVELHPNDAESWLGLAASYDRLRRFDLADRAYVQATKLTGNRAEVLNNHGFSYMLRGDYRRAHEKLAQAHEVDPGNVYVRNNLQLLQASARKSKGIE